MVKHTCDSSTPEAEVGRWPRVQGQPKPQSKHLSLKPTSPTLVNKENKLTIILVIREMQMKPSKGHK